MHPDKILRLGASGEIQCFFPITIEKIEVGTLAVVSTNENIKSGIFKNCQDGCAGSVSPYLEDI